jgi:dihydroxyacetone kinase-like protein
MSDGLTTEKLKQAVGRVRIRLEACQDELNTIDGQLGDGDIGISMVDGIRGIEKVRDELPEDVGMALFKCAQAFSSTGGSSFATLIATGLMSAAKMTRGLTSVSWDDLPDLLAAAIEKMAARGRSQLGDKTVLDALEAIRVSLGDANDPGQMLVLADRAVAGALDAFRMEPCKQGRARIFGDKSIGLDDPGMVVIKRILEGLAEPV